MNVRASLVKMVHQLLVNLRDTMDWIKKGGTKPEGSSLVVLRLVVILCLMNLNFRECGDLLFQLLGSSQITDHLPLEFHYMLRRGWKRNAQGPNLLLIAEAFEKIGNPLVIASFRINSSEFECPSAIFIDMKAGQREEISRILFPKNKDTQGHAIDADRILPPPLSPDEEKSSDVACSKSANTVDLNSDVTNNHDKEENDLRTKLGLLWRSVSALSLAEDEKTLESVILHAPNIKVGLTF